MGLPRLASAALVVAAAGIVLTSCAATRTSQPQRYKQFFLPPQHGKSAEPVQEAFADPPRLSLYSSDYPLLPIKPTPIPRPTDAEFVIQRANDRFAAGKRALQQGQPEEARLEFNRAVEVLLSAPENLPDHAALLSVPERGRRSFPVALPAHRPPGDPD